MLFNKSFLMENTQRKMCAKKGKSLVQSVEIYRFL